jgi:hypothetical protein
MNACGGAVLPVVVNIAGGMREEGDAKVRELRHSWCRYAADASQPAWAATGRALRCEIRQERG